MIKGDIILYPLSFFTIVATLYIIFRANKSVTLSIKYKSFHVKLAVKEAQKNDLK